MITFRFTSPDFEGYHDRKGLKQKPKLDAKTMTFLSENLSTLLSKPHVQSKWDANLVGDLEQVAIVFQEFGDFLEKHKQDETEHQACLYPARQV